MHQLIFKSLSSLSCLTLALRALLLAQEDRRRPLLALGSAADRAQGSGGRRKGAGGGVGKKRKWKGGRGSSVAAEGKKKPDTWVP